METIEELKKKRTELVETITEMDSDASKVEIYELHGEIDDIDRRIHAIDPSQVWQNPDSQWSCYGSFTRT